MNFLPGFVTTNHIKLSKELFKNSRISYILTYSLSNGYSWLETPVLYFEENPGYNRTRKGIKIVWDLQPCRTEGSGKPQGNKTRPHYNHIFYVYTIF